MLNRKSVRNVSIEFQITIFKKINFLLFSRQTDYEAIRELLPNISFVSIPDTGHYLHVEKPNQFVDSVVQFLKSN